MKILVLRVINSSRHSKCFVRDICTSCLCQNPSLVRVFDTNNSCIYPVQSTFYDVNYIYIYINNSLYLARKYLAPINRGGGLYRRILTEVVSTDRTQ